MWKFLSDSIDRLYDSLSFESKNSSISSQTLSNNINLSKATKKWLRLSIQIIGILFIFFGIWSFVSALLMKWYLPAPIPVIFTNFSFGIMGLTLVVAGYKLFQMQEKGRKLAYILTWANLASLALTSGASFINKDAIFSYKFWSFQYQYVSKNPSFDGSIFVLIIAILVGLEIVLILFFLSQAVKELFTDRTKS